jgi:hypothetical protein
MELCMLTDLERTNNLKKANFAKNKNAKMAGG